jgi:hypothetical protein
VAQPGDLILERYRLTDRLALGGTAEVWRARDDQLDRDVAVKLLHSHLLPDQSSRRRLAAEARAAAGLSHPAIVAMYDVDADGDPPALVMQLVEGESLAARLARGGALSGRETASIGAEVAEGLFEAHKQGIVHRDVKPGNVLLDRAGHAHLVDFGIAHSLAVGAERLTLTGTVIGTLRYMAPEQLTGQPVGPRTDLWGLGATLHEALTGRPPYSEPTPVALAEAQRSGPPPMQDADPALAALVVRCLAHDPAQRPLHAGAVADALHDWLGGRTETALNVAPAAALGPAAAGAAGAAGAAAAAGESPTQAETRPVIAPPPAPSGGAVNVAAAAGAGLRSAATAPRRRWLGALLAAVLAALALTGIMLALLGSGGRSPFAGPSPPFTPTPSPTVATTPAPTPPATPTPAPPEWAEELLAEHRQECGFDYPATAADLEALGRDAAREQVKAAVQACRVGGGGGDD